MGETNNEKTGFAQGLKAEFQKVIWPDKKTLGKQAVAVTAISIVLGAIIALLDTVVQYAINLLTTL